MSLAFAENGCAIVKDVLTPEHCSAIVEYLPDGGPARIGSRDLLKEPWCRELALDVKHHVAVAEHLPDGAVAVQCTLFDKSTAKNWLVALHQDLSIPLSARVSHPDLAGWSEKEGILFVQPPVSVLESLVAVRVHLDDSGPRAGPLRVIPGSHRHGRLSRDEAFRLRHTLGEYDCLATRGDALLMRPLLLHASSKAITPARRRVLHFLFGPSELPFGLRWSNAI
jgi:Phytanoyl-CoA dioxygenase (PhyH)